MADDKKEVTPTKAMEIEVKRKEKVDTGKKNEKGEPVFTEKEVTNIVPIVTHVHTRGLGKGNTYHGPNFLTLKGKEGLEYLTSIWGHESLMKNLIVPKLKTFCNIISSEAEENAKGDEAKYVSEYERMFSELSRRGESTMGLKLQIAELIAQMSKLDDQAPDYQERIMSIASELRECQTSLQEKKAKDKTPTSEEETEPAKVAA